MASSTKQGVLPSSMGEEPGLHDSSKQQWIGKIIWIQGYFCEQALNFY